MDLKTSLNDVTLRRAYDEEILAADNIWTAIEVLTNQLGNRVGSHLETLLGKETAAELPSWWSVLYAEEDCIHLCRHRTEEQAREAAKARLAQAELAGGLLTVYLMTPDHQLQVAGESLDDSAKDGPF